MTTATTADQTDSLSWAPRNSTTYRVVWTGTPHSEVDLQQLQPYANNRSRHRWVTIGSCKAQSRPSRMKDLQIELMNAYQSFSYCFNLNTPTIQTDDN